MYCRFPGLTLAEPVGGPAARGPRHAVFQVSTAWAGNEPDCAHHVLVTTITTHLAVGRHLGVAVEAGLPPPKQQRGSSGASAGAVITLLRRKSADSACLCLGSRRVCDA